MPRKPAGRVALTVSALSAFLSLTACGHDAPTASDLATEPTLDARVIALADPKTVAQPLAQYMFTASDLGVIDRATLISVNRCMADFGFPAATTWPRTSTDDLWGRYGLWEQSSAQTGYLSPERLESSTESGIPFAGDALRVYNGEVSEFNGAGVPAGGCAAVSSDAVWNVPGVKDLSNYVQHLYLEARQRALQDSRVQPLLNAWQNCMEEKGWDYATVLAPFAYWNQYPRRGTNKYLTIGSISAEEKASAADDLACKRSTKLLGTWLAADVAYQELIIEREAQALSDWPTNMDKIRTNAAQVISSGA